MLALALLLTGLWSRPQPAHAQEPIYLRYGQYAQNIINHRVHRWTYIFDAQRGDLVTLAVELLDGNLDPYITLSDLDGNILAEDDDSGEGLAPRLEYGIRATGRYMAVVSRFGGEEFLTHGVFVLRLDGVADGIFDAPPEGHTVLLPGVEASGMIDGSTPEGLFTFLGWRGDTVNLTLRLNRGNLTSRVSIYLPEGGGRLAEAIAGPEGGLASGDLSLPLTGYYRVRVDAAPESPPDATGGYALALHLSEGSFPEHRADATHIALPPGRTSSADLDAARPALYYTFEAEAGEFVRAMMAVTDGDLAPLLILLDTEGHELAFDNTPGAALIGQARLPHTGRYILSAERLGGAGHFTLAVQLLDPADIIYPGGAFTVTLRWEGAANLDLVVRDPAGERLAPDSAHVPSGGVFYGDGVSCPAPTDAVEHVYWPEAAPAGVYEIIVWHREECGSDFGGDVSFELVVAADGVELERTTGALCLGAQYRTLVTYP